MSEHELWWDYGSVLGNNNYLKSPWSILYYHTRICCPLLRAIWELHD